jgi:hypothetical protein
MVRRCPDSGTVRGGSVVAYMGRTTRVQVGWFAQVIGRVVDACLALHIKRSKVVAPVFVLILTIGVIAAVWLLVGRASVSREAQLQVSAMRLSLADLQAAPFSADPALGGSAAATRVRESRPTSGRSRRV